MTIQVFELKIKQKYNYEYIYFSNRVQLDSHDTNVLNTILKKYQTLQIHRQNGKGKSERQTLM